MDDRSELSKRKSNDCMRSMLAIYDIGEVI